MIIPPKEERKHWVCYEPHKRVRLPDKDDYSLFVGVSDDTNTPCLKTAKGYVVEKFRDGVSDEIYKAWSLASIQLYHTHLNQYYTHKRANPEYYVPTYEEANMTHRFAYRGFTWDRPIDFYTNWFGVSVYEPNNIFRRGNKKIIMSLQGMAMPSPNTEEDWALAEAMACKYIGFYEDGTPIYESWSGQLPEQDWIEKFIQ